MHSRSGTLTAVPPFDFNKSIDFLRGFKPMTDDQELRPNRIRKAICFDGNPVLLELTGTATTEEPSIGYTLRSERPLPDSLQKRLARCITRFLSLEDDLQPFYAIAQQDPKFRPVVKALWGLHHVRFPSLFESLCWAILAQHNLVAVARKTKRRLTEERGRSMQIEDGRYWAFPDHSLMKDMNERELLAIVGNRKRAEYFSELLKVFPSLDEDRLTTMDYDRAEAELRRIKGIGEWSAAFVLLRGLGRMERLMANLNPVLKAMKDVYGPNATMEEIQERYAASVGYWAFYLRVYS